MKNSRKAMLWSVVAVCMLALHAQAADKIGEWPYLGNIGRGSTSGSEAYIRYYGDMKAGLIGTEKQMVVLQPFSLTSIWTTDSSAAETTGTWEIASWLGHTGTVTWTVADTAITEGLMSTQYTVYFQVRNFSGEEWYTAWSHAVADDSVNAQIRDTLDFTQPLMRAPFGRWVVDGNATNLTGKASTVTMTVKMERTGIQTAPAATATATATCP